MSLEEQRQRQEEVNQNAETPSVKDAPSAEIPDNEEALLQQALRMSGAMSTASGDSTPFPDDVRLEVTYIGTTH